MAKQVPAQPRRILCIRMSAVGDVINTLPALEAIRISFPEAHIAYMVEDRAFGVIDQHPSVNEVILYPRKRWVQMLRNPRQWRTVISELLALRRHMRETGFDVVLNFQSNLKGAIFSVMSGARVRVGFSSNTSKENSHLFNHINVTPEGGELINRVDKFIALASAIGADPERAAYRLPYLPPSAERVNKWIKEHNLSDYAVIHPGTSDFGASKRWLPERFSELAQRLNQEMGLVPIITWGPGEQSLAQQIVDASGGSARLAMQTAHLLDLAEITRDARLYVGCDSGPLHLASAVGTPSVALFGPKDPRTYGPYNPRSRVVQKATDTRAYTGEMINITVEDVMQACRELLNEIAGT